MLSIQIQNFKNLSKQALEPYSRLGMNVTKVGDRVLQTLCGEFDSHRLHFLAFVPQLVQEEPGKLSFVSSTLTEGCFLSRQMTQLEFLTKALIQSLFPFEFARVNHARLGKLVNPAALEAAFSRFESETGHQAQIG